MVNWGKKIGSAVGAVGLKSAGKYLSENLEYVINKTSLSPFDADQLNKGEDEQIYKKRKKTIPVPEMKPDINKKNILQRHISTWSDDDIMTIMKSDDYKYDKYTQDKVKNYFEFNYPGNAKYDATGRMIEPKRKPFL